MCTAATQDREYRQGLHSFIKHNPRSVSGAAVISRMVALKAVGHRMPQTMAGRCGADQKTAEDGLESHKPRNNRQPCRWRPCYQDASTQWQQDSSSCSDPLTTLAAPAADAVTHPCVHPALCTQHQAPNTNDCFVHPLHHIHKEREHAISCCLATLLLLRQQILMQDPAQQLLLLLAGAMPTQNSKAYPVYCCTECS